MKVLWFTNSSANADEYFNKQLKGTGGWLKSFDAEMQNKVDLHIAFYHNEDISSFKYRGTTYYPIYNGNRSIINKYLNAIKAKVIFKQDVKIYIDIINSVKPDLIHIHGTENPFGYIMDEINIPVVISIQGNITVCYHKYLSGLEKKYLNVTKGFLYSIIGYKPFEIGYNRFKFMKKRELYSFDKCNNFIGRTSWDRRISSVLSPDSKYYHVDEILRKGFYTASWQNNNQGLFNIFTTNGNTYYKGFETLCQSISLLIKTGFTNFEWRVAGISDKDLIVFAVKKKLGDMYPKSNLILLGNLDEQDLINNLLESNLYVMTSHIENSPNNLCEAMIIGMPCIATFAGGTGSILSDKNEGILIQDGDPWAMAGAILEMANNPEKAIQYGKNAHKVALKRHNKEKIAEDLLTVYKEILISANNNNSL